MKNILCLILFIVLSILFYCCNLTNNSENKNQNIEILQDHYVLNYPFTTNNYKNSNSEFSYKIFNHSLSYNLLIPDIFNPKLSLIDNPSNSENDFYPPSSKNSSITRLSLIGERDSYFNAHLFDCERVISDLCQLFLDSSQNMLLNLHFNCKFLFSTGILKTNETYINSYILEDTISNSLIYHYTSVNLSNNLKINIEVGSYHSLDKKEINIYFQYFQHLFSKQIAQN